jgi:hypothetical protein
VVVIDHGRGDSGIVDQVFLPDEWNIVGQQSLVTGDNGRSLGPCLCHKQTIERIPVIPRQALDGGSVIERDR